MTSDIKEVIARVRIDRQDAERHGYGCTEVGHNDIDALLSAAEAGLAARDAALEEAAKVAEAVDPEKPANWLHPRHKIAFAIRALRSKP